MTMIHVDEEKSLVKNHLKSLRLAHSKEPIPYTGDIEISPMNTERGDLGHKKVTVVGCGQVGMAIAYAMLNQVTAGTIALVDMNKEKLKGEAMDLEQGSAFHQHVRIVASDDYVSRTSMLMRWKFGLYYIGFGRVSFRHSR
jgi:threonine dehydrogenase-like Zn-dependent dehydrogenase